MTPQIICPYCNKTINLKARRDIDHALIINALKTGPKRFTDLYYTTYLPRKTLSLRLKDLCSAKFIIKRDNYYYLNGIHSSNKDNPRINLKGELSVLTRNIRIIALIMLWLIPSAVLAYALMTKPARVIISPDKPIASFHMTPDPSPNLGWEIEGAKIIAGETLVTFNASNSYDPDGTIVEYVWDFGDGKSGNGISVTHVYSKPGHYCVQLTVIDEGGNRNYKTKDVVVYAKPTSEIYLNVESNGQYLTVFIIVQNIKGLYGWQAGLQFNPNALKCLAVEKGSSQPQETYNTTYVYSEGLFPGSEGLTLWFEPKIDNENGIISPMSCTLLGDSTPVSGSGVLAKITFEILSDQSYNLKLNNVILCMNNGEEIPVIVKQ